MSFMRCELCGLRRQSKNITYMWVRKKGLMFWRSIRIPVCYDCMPISDRVQKFTNIKRVETND